MGRVVVDVPWVMGVTLLSLQIASAGTVHSGLLRNSGSATVVPASPTESAQTLRGNNAANVLATRPADDPGAAACPRPASHGGTDLGRLGPMAVPASKVGQAQACGEWRRAIVSVVAAPLAKGGPGWPRCRTSIRRRGRPRFRPGPYRCRLASQWRHFLSRWCWR